MWMWSRGIAHPHLPRKWAQGRSIDQEQPVNRNETLSFCLFVARWLHAIYAPSSFCPLTYLVAVCFPMWAVVFLLLRVMSHSSLWALWHLACPLLTVGAL